MHRQPARFRDHVAQGDVAPTQARGERDARAGGVHHAGHADADAVAAAELLVILEKAIDAGAQDLDESPGIGRRGKARDADDGLGQEIRHHQEGPGRPDVDGDDAAFPGIDVEELRLAAAGGFPLRPLEQDAVGDEVVDDEADGAAAGVHEPRQVGARDGLRGADQVEQDLSVDFAGRSAMGDANWGVSHGLSNRGTICGITTCPVKAPGRI